jgi:hypothetical protein
MKRYVIIIKKDDIFSLFSFEPAYQKMNLSDVVYLLKMIKKLTFFSFFFSFLILFLKIHQLTGMSGGVLRKNRRPEAWNPDTVWEIIRNMKEGDICCAGTQSAASGHHGLTSKGLSPGHAYGILGSKEIDGIKLVKMMNPWGKKRGEWTGDWSDESPLWTKRMKAKAGTFFEPGDDGIFILTVLDFTKNFKSLYVSSFDDMISYKKSHGLILKAGMKIVANGSFNRNSGSNNNKVPSGTKGEIIKFGPKKNSYGIPESAYCKWDNGIRCWSWPPEGDILPDMDDPENKVKSISKDKRQAKINEIGLDKWNRLSWTERLNALE